MATVSRQLPHRPHLDVPKREARELLAELRAGQAPAFDRTRRCHPRYHDTTDSAFARVTFKLSDAQQVIAREYGFNTWAALKQRIDGASTASLLQTAIEHGDRDVVVELLRAHPALLHVPLWSGNWGPPMSHAANLGRLEIVQAVAELGARDYQHAFDRAVLQGQIECARWLHAHSAKLLPGIIMGSCETLNLSGFKFLLELGAPLVDVQGNRLAPLSLVLETYARNPVGKHGILELFAAQGYTWPDTPMMALHRGDLARLREFLRQDPRLLERRFSLSELYPPECGCAHAGRSGMHWTPLDGTTLLHLAIDFRERAIFDWLLAEGIDVNAPATKDSEGFGDHTALFNAVVSGPSNDSFFAAELLKRGARRDPRASLRKFLDWCEQPRWHEARAVTPAEWADTFPERGWVNEATVALVKTEQPPVHA
ncbi:MAG: ankyrin repeat domain-containing protein [Opitutus sp.]